jgi:hypothetical protein
MKMRVLLTLAGLAIGFAVPALAQEQNTVDPEVRQQIEAALTKFDEAFNRNDASAIADQFRFDAVDVWAGAPEGGWSLVNKRSRKDMRPSPHRV